MIEIPDKLDFHNFNLDCKPELWFKRSVKETSIDWLNRIARKSDTLEEFKWRTDNQYWLDDSFDISFAVLAFLRENKMEKETLEELPDFELDLSGKYDWKLSELKKLELYTNIKLWKK